MSHKRLRQDAEATTTPKLRRIIKAKQGSPKWRGMFWAVLMERRQAARR